MYQDAFIWNVFKGCEFDCIYCKSSFQRQAKRQKPTIDKNGNFRGCQDCYDYKPHFHPERLNQSLPNTVGDQFIWVGSSGDISFCKKERMDLILERIKKLPHKTFFFQTKDPKYFWDLDLPENVILGITLETNRGNNYKIISKALIPPLRANDFIERIYDRKFITIEPIIDFDLDNFIFLITSINPERIYIGYDTKKCRLPEPSLKKTLNLIRKLRERGFYVKEKLMRKAWWEDQ